MNIQTPIEYLTNKEINKNSLRQRSRREKKKRKVEKEPVRPFCILVLSKDNSLNALITSHEIVFTLFLVPVAV